MSCCRCPAVDICKKLHSLHVTGTILSMASCALPVLGSPTGDSDGELLARFCGQTIPTVPIVVFTPELWVQFQTDASQGDLGFMAKYLFSGKVFSGIIKKIL